MSHHFLQIIGISPRQRMLTLWQALKCSLYFVFSILFCVCLSLPAQADDGAMYTGDPRFTVVQQGAAIRARKATFTYSMKQLHSPSAMNRLVATYVLENTSSKKENMQLIFTVPECTWAGFDNWYPDRSYSDLRLVIDGVQVPYEASRKAVRNGKDITHVIQSYGLAPLAITDIDRWTEELTEFTKQKIAPLVAMGLFSENFEPLWTVQNTYSYSLAVPPGKTAHIEYSYANQWGASIVSCEEEGLEALGAEMGIDMHGVLANYGASANHTRYFYFNWLKIPVWSTDWEHGIDVVTLQVTIDAHAELLPTDEARMIVVSMNNTVWNSKKELQLTQHHVDQAGALPLLILAPMPE